MSGNSNTETSLILSCDKCMMVCKVQFYGIYIKSKSWMFGKQSF